MGNLISEILFLFQQMNWLTILDLLLVTGVFYILMMMMRDTQGMVLLRGILFLAIAVALLTSLFDLPAFSWLVKTALPGLLFAIPVIFAPEIRRGLTRLGQAHIGPVFLFRSPISNEVMGSMIKELVIACTRLASLYYGALIVIQRRDTLRQYVNTGVTLGAKLTAELLLQVFYPNTPLHDGAVVIVEDRLQAAACVMPLSTSRSLNRSQDRQMGLRHRAALGICEMTDALAVVVSEETGEISLGHGGRLIRHIQSDKLNNVLTAFYHQPGFLPSSSGVMTRIQSWLKRERKVEKK